MRHRGIIIIEVVDNGFMIRADGIERVIDGRETESYSPMEVYTDRKKAEKRIKWFLDICTNGKDSK